jgi:hypothetical protein
MRFYTQNGPKKVKGTSESRKVIHKEVRFWRSKLAHMMDRYYDHYNEASKLYGRLLSEKEVSLSYVDVSKAEVVERESWPKSLWNRLLSPLRNMVSDLETIREAVAGDILKKFRSELDSRNVAQFERAVKYLDVSIDAFQGIQSLDVEKETGWLPAETYALRGQVYESALVPGWTGMVMAWSALFFSTADVSTSDIIVLSPNDTDRWRKAVAYLKYHFPQRDGESFYDFLGRIMREHEKYSKEAKESSPVARRIKMLQFLSKIVERAERLAQDKSVIVQVFDESGEQIWVGTPTSVRSATEVAKKMKMADGESMEMAPNSDSTMDELSMLRAIWQSPMVLSS